jgi:tetratricopeptide (TPR) repeat protein
MSIAEDQHKLQTAYSLHQKGSLNEAAKLYRELVKSNPNNFHALQFLGLVEAGAGNIEEARRLMARSLSIQPPNVQFVENYATLLYRIGDYISASQICERGLRLTNTSVSLLYIYANSMFKLDKLQDSLVQFDKLLSLQPKHVAALNERGSVLAQTGQYDAALASFTKALNIDPRFAETHLNMGNLYSVIKRYNEAFGAYDKALALKPDLANAWLGRGNLFRELKRYDESLAAYERALRLDRTLANAWLGRGNVFRDLERAEEALASYDKAISLAPQFAEGWLGRGNVFRDLDRLEEALASYEKALALKPGFAEAHDRKGWTLLELGRVQEASHAIEKAIASAPKRARFYHNLAESTRFAPGDPHIQAMEELARDMPSLREDEQIDLHFALAKAFADIGDPARSFARLLEGNGLKRKQIVYDEAATLDVLERTRAAFTNELMRSRQGQGEPSAVPVFIVGMPRSGTTLVEQILASHPKVFGAGEIDDFGKAIEALGGAARHSPETASLLSGEQLRQLGASYVERIRAGAPAAERIANKTPDNFRFAGLIHLALPNARIIHTRRDPVDTCLSCFATLFAENLAPYAYDLEELGRYYRAYEKLMAHWRGALPQGAMLEVQYEAVVGDLEGQARRILAYCGLEWDARCLDFHRTERLVRTASLAQVRQPIYKSSVGRWRVYEPFLGPLLAELAPSIGSVTPDRP